MTSALTTAGSQPAWLTELPEAARNQLMAQLAAQPKDVAARLVRAAKYADSAMLAACTTAEEAIDLLKMLAESEETDGQAKYIPPVYTINHRHQKFQDDAGDTIKGTLRAVILHFQPTRGFFIEGRKLPLCSAIGNLLNGKAQADAAEDWAKYQLFTGIPLEWETNNCATCPFNEFGTDPKTLAGKACKEKYRLFLALVDEQGQMTGEGVMLNVPTTSMKNWDTYVSHLKRHKTEAGKLQPLTSLQVVTEFGLEKAQGQGQDYAKILFRASRPLNPQEFKWAYETRKQIVKVAEELGVEVGETYDQVDTGNGEQPAAQGGDDGVDF